MSEPIERLEDDLDVDDEEFDDEQDDEIEEDEQAPLAVRFAAEFAGTFILIFIGLGVVLYNGIVRQEDPLISALAFGVGLSAAIALFANVSGGHVNPAVSLGAAIKGQLRWIELPVYVVAQLLGAAAATAVLFFTIPEVLQAQTRALFTLVASGPETAFSVGQIVALEAIGAAILVAVCLGTRSWVRNAVVPVIAGLTLTGLILMLSNITGASFNPARSTASVIFADWDTALGDLWIFWAAPLLGGAVAGLSYAIFAPRPVAEEDDEEDDDEDWEDDQDWDELERATTAVGSDDEAVATDTRGSAPVEDQDGDLDADSQGDGDSSPEDSHEADDADDPGAIPDSATLEFDPDSAQPVARVDGEPAEDDEDDDPRDRA